MPSNEMLLVLSSMIKIPLFDLASRTQSPLGHVNVNCLLSKSMFPLKPNFPLQSLMSPSSIKSMASLSPLKSVTSHLTVGDSDGSLETLGTSDGKILFDGEKEGSSDGERLGSFDGKSEVSKVGVGDSDGSLERTLGIALGPLEGLGALEPLEGFGALEPLEGFVALEPSLTAFAAAADDALLALT